MTLNQVEYLLGAAEAALENSAPTRPPTVTVDARVLQSLLRQMREMNHALGRIIDDPLLSVLVQRVEPKVMFIVRQVRLPPSSSSSSSRAGSPDCPTPSPAG